MNKQQRKSLKAAKRKAQELERQQELDAIKASHRRIAREHLVKFGAWEAVKNTNVADQLDRFVYGDPEVVLDSRVESNDLTAHLRSALSDLLKEAAFDSEILGEGFSVREYFRHVKPIVDFLRRVHCPDPGRRTEIDAAVQRIGDLGTIAMEIQVLSHIQRRFDDVVIKFGNIQVGMYYSKFAVVAGSRGKKQIRFTIYFEPPDFRSIVKDDGNRNAYRCGQPNMQRIDWVQWDSSECSLIPSGHVMSVYVQKHALEQLYLRLCAFRDEFWVVHEWLWQSLKQPTFAEKRLGGGKFLVEYRFFQYKLGYLVGQVVDGVVLIDTFLFLTMDGTPEGDQLWRRLRLMKEDKKYLGADSLGFFLFTDVQNDEGLVRILSDCGCGHLFRMLKEPKKDCASGIAAGFRKHLLLGEATPK